MSSADIGQQLEEITQRLAQLREELDEKAEVTSVDEQVISEVLGQEVEENVTESPLW